MHIIERINAISKRAEAINLPMSRLCAAAGVHHSTISRWQSGAEFKVRRATDICDRLEGELRQRERAMLNHLTRCVDGRAA